MSSSRPNIKKHDSPASITPQRKHRKLLKDGSGTEVWPESIEKIFVQGLREYWDSPYATYSQSRGRSRWRNQFLVDFLNKQGIERSKKQVASHIQVLRNMWKGEPEFHLVAGGDELYPDDDSPVTASVKLEDQYDSNTLIAFDWDEHEHPSSNSVSPNFSPADSQSEFPPTPEHRPNLYPSDFGSVAPKLQSIDHGYPTPTINSPSISPHGDYIQQLPPFHDSTAFGHPSYQAATKYSNPPTNVPTTPFAVAPNRSSRASIQDPTAQHSQPAVAGRHMSATPTHYRYPRNRVTSVQLHADGMTPFSVKVDALANPAQPVQPPFTLRIRLCMPASDNQRAPPPLNGFFSGIILDNVWSSNAKCITKVYASSACIGVNEGTLTLSPTHFAAGTVLAILPDSALTSCRYLDSSVPTIITQEIIVDDEALLFLMYELDRKTGGAMPSAMLLGYQKYRGGTTSTSQTPAAHQIHTSISPSPGAPIVGPHAALYARANSQQPTMATPNYGVSQSISTMTTRRQY